MRTICYLREIGRGDTPKVGSKAGALGELLRAGFNVPDGFVLTTDAYAQVIEGLRDRLESRVTADAINDPAEIESLAGEVREWIETESWPPDLHTELGIALAASTSLGKTRSFAARTSLPSDELATAFGSGVQRAVLGLNGLGSVERGAARCWAALWTSRSMYYRHRKKIPQTQVSLAVLVQPMVEADSAGTIFTQNPLTNDPDEMQIDSIWGLGTPLTQARVKPDRFLFCKHDRTIGERQIEDKALRLAVANGGGLEQQLVLPGDIGAPSLTDHQVVDLARVASRIEELFGEPQHIEWARVGEQFYILQSRPTGVRRN